MEIDDMNNKITINDKNGEKKDYEILGYVNNEYGNYVVYTDGKMLNNENVALYVNLLVKEDDGSLSFEDVTDEELTSVIKELQERMK